MIAKWYKCPLSERVAVVEGLPIAIKLRKNELISTPNIQQ
jgi:hypothetical protein